MSFAGVPHRKQFVVGPSAQLLKLALPERFIDYPIGNGLSIYACPDLQVVSAQSKNGRLNFLIGTVVEARPERDSPESVLRLLNSENLETLTRSWTGHWLLITDDTLYGDCCGLFSVYIPRRELLEKKGELFISNSPVLISQIYGVNLQMFSPKLAAAFPMAPTTFMGEFRTLLAGEYLNLKNATRDLAFIQFEPRNIDMEEVRSSVAEMLATSIARLQCRTDSRTLCAISGGYDSRLNLAAAMTSSASVEAFTFQKSYLYITDADRRIPREIAQATTIKHKMITAKKFDPEYARTYIEHSGGSVSSFPGSGFDHYVHGYWNEAGTGRTVLDGQCYELAVNYHRKKFPQDFDLAHLVKFGFSLSQEDYSDVQKHWAQQPLSEKLDRRDLIFWTGNINGVYARMTQEHDLFVDLFYPACNREQMNLLLSVPVPEREDCLFQATITARLQPMLASFPYNTPEPLIKRVVKRMRNELFQRLRL